MFVAFTGTEHGLYDFIFLVKKGCVIMQEIGEALREARENIGLSLEEAASDLKMASEQLMEIEEGNLCAFKDVVSLKYFIRDYSKYLGLDYEEMMDEFNEYLFDYTSRISLEDIKRAAKKAEAKEKQEKRVASPYTLEKKRRWKIPAFLIYTFVVALILGICYGLYQIFFVNQEEAPEDNVVATSRVLE